MARVIGAGADGASSIEREVVLRVGEDVVVELPEFASAGFLWDVEGLRRASVVRAEREAASPAPAYSEQTPIGGATTVRLLLRGERTGEASMAHARPWTGGGETAGLLRVVVRPREGGMAPHDMFVGKEFVLNGLRMRAEDLPGRSHVVARRLDGDDSSRWSGIPNAIPLHRLSDALDVIQALPPPASREPEPGSLWRHRKGGLYVVEAPDIRDEGTGEPGFIGYRGVAMGDRWVRRASEFLDQDGQGFRFERVA